MAPQRAEGKAAKVFVVIAAFNEELAIAETVLQVRQYVDDVVVVDDHSIDATFEAALQSGAHVVRHPLNLGQGAALQTGIEYALARNADYIVTFDADGQHAANEIAGMYRALVESGAEVALGSRFLGSANNLSLSRRILLKAAIAFTHLTTGVGFSDVHNGFRVISRGFAEKFHFQQNRMAHASEILAYIAHKKIPYIEFPVTVAYTDYSVSKGQRNSNSIRILMELILGKISK